MKKISRFSGDTIYFASTIERFMNTQRIISVLYAHQQRIKRCNITVSSDSDLRGKIIRPFVKFPRFCLVRYADKWRYELGINLWV